ncbi:MAG TPA: hypothetical protein DET40_14310 [Lentisphaeria bacterium]|nr:MAG: hypothetical protein A2X45_05485 [Lentisphaerae bacterium GWF2_50_93]HCE44711.1 hypothetical protein [Lentisphaeria bacterium]
MKMEKLGNSCVEVVKYAYSRQVFQPAVPFQWRVRKPALLYLGTPFYFETISNNGLEIILTLFQLKIGR